MATRTKNLRVWLDSLLRVEDAPSFHEGLTKRLGTPHTAYCRGESVPDRPRESYRFSLWCIEYVGPQCDQVSRHCRWLTRLIHGHEPFFRELARAGKRAVFHLAIHSSPGASEVFDFDAQALRALQRARISLEFCIDTSEPSRPSGRAERHISST